jgi:hypothetical protein
MSSQLHGDPASVSPAPSSSAAEHDAAEGMAGAQLETLVPALSSAELYQVAMSQRSPFAGMAKARSPSHIGTRTIGWASDSSIGPTRPLSRSAGRVPVELRRRRRAVHNSCPKRAQSA